MPASPGKPELGPGDKGEIHFERVPSTQTRLTPIQVNRQR